MEICTEHTQEIVYVKRRNEDCPLCEAEQEIQSLQEQIESLEVDLEEEKSKE